MKNSIQKVLDSDLCIGCGTCYSACPLGAISMIRSDIFIPSIEEEKCNDCGLCELSCPGFHVDYASQKSETTNYSSLIGKYVDIYLGHAKDQYVRLMGSSGGVITALLTYALEKGIVDGVLVVSLDRMNPKIFVARSTTEVKHAMGSKYLPVPLNLGLRNILDMDGEFAVVGLPCHLLGLDRIISIYPSLAKKIILRLGLFCGRGFDYYFVNYVLKGFGISAKDVRAIRFRGNGWPGKVFVGYVSGSRSQELYFDYSKLGNFSGGYLFMPKRCIFCPDHTAELADISFGDAWLQEIKSVDSQGTSLMITRTALGNKMLLEAARDGFVRISASCYRDVARSQYSPLSFHKLSFAARCSVARALGVKMPLIKIESAFESGLFVRFVSLVVVATQIVYWIVKKLGISEKLPKPFVKICGKSNFLLSMTVFKLAVRDKIV